jgi:hypothetical protein
VSNVTASCGSSTILNPDLFEKNTYWELETERATAQQIEAGAWQVTLDVRRKMVVDEAGVETEVPMDNWIEVASFTRVSGTCRSTASAPDAGEWHGEA